MDLILLADDAGDLEYGHQQRDGNGPNDESHEGDHERFNQRGRRADGVLQLFRKENRNLITNLTDLSRFFAGAHHLNNTRGNKILITGGHNRI